MQIQPSLIIEYLQAHKGKHFESYAIAKAIGSGPSHCRYMLRRLVDLKAVQTIKEGRKNVYFIRDGVLPETRTFIQKPWVMPDALRDQLKRCEEAREIRSKFD